MQLLVKIKMISASLEKLWPISGLIQDLVKEGSENCAPKVDPSKVSKAFTATFST